MPCRSRGVQDLHASILRIPFAHGLVHRAVEMRVPVERVRAHDQARDLRLAELDSRDGRGGLGGSHRETGRTQQKFTTAHIKSIRSYYTSYNLTRPVDAVPAEFFISTWNPVILDASPVTGNTARSAKAPPASDAAKNDAKSAVLSTAMGGSGSPGRRKTCTRRTPAVRVLSKPFTRSSMDVAAPGALGGHNADRLRRDCDGLPVRDAAEFDRDGDRPGRRAGLERNGRKVAEVHLGVSGRDRER